MGLYEGVRNRARRSVPLRTSDSEIMEMRRELGDQLHLKSRHMLLVANFQKGSRNAVVATHVNLYGMLLLVGDGTRLHNFKVCTAMPVPLSSGGSRPKTRATPGMCN